ncbi:21505_t:CDS:10 [Dentiscutata erythropus]|uniref:21505_t:CDS:1 n=1 Tax=Dentiscutata erythropus TaxID=1348616 RepID=A0A9N9CTE6_9GLOM|nr:21505_t:CDS:10 [Dentiscutata erythropus]
MVFWTFIVVIAILLITYDKINSKTPDGLKNIHTITLFSRIFLIITKQFGHDKLYFRYKQYFENDGIVKERILGKWVCMVTDPAIAKDLLLKQDVYPKVSIEKTFPNSLFAKYIGTNVAFSSGDLQPIIKSTSDFFNLLMVLILFRRVCNPAFKILPLHLFAEAALKMIDILETIDKKPVEIKNLMQRFTLDVLGKVAFGFDFNSLGNPNSAYVTAYNEVQKAILDPLTLVFSIDHIPIIRQQRLKKLAKLNNLFKEIIKEKHKALAAGKSREDLLEHMLNANENLDNQILSDTELRHNLAVFMLAGHETTAIALSTILYLLSTYKNIQEKAREEVLRILGDNLIPSAEQHKSLKYLNMIIHENLRLYPPAPTLIYRELTEDLKFKNSIIPAGTIIELFLYGIHHSPKLWDNPEEFLPERFEKERTTSENYTWLAFGGGTRMCLGNNFSLIEQRIVLCLLCKYFNLRKYEISLAPNSIHKDGLKIQIQMSPHPIELIFKRRD